VLELTGPTEKLDGLNQIMKHYSGRAWPISANDTEDIRVWKIAIESLTGNNRRISLTPAGWPEGSARSG